jgi:hypothetical protein
METLYLGFNVKGQQLTRTDSYTVYSGSVNFVGAKFIFDWHWNNTNRYAQFVVGENTYTKDIINGVCSVPWECFASAGTFTVTVFGGTLITANAITITVLESGLAEGEFPSEPTPGYFDEVVTMVNEAKADTIFAAGGAEADRILAEDAKNEARKWVDGTGATEGDPQFDNHSKYHAEESQAWAIGTADTEKEQHNNSAKDHAMAAKTSEDNAKTSETNAGRSATTASQALSDTLAILGEPGGVATLDESGKLTASQIPYIALTDTIDVASVAAMLALTTEQVQKGDVARIITDGEVTDTYLLAGDDPSQATSWKMFRAGYAATAGHADTSDTAADAERINGHRIVAMTQEQYEIAEAAGTLDANTIYLVGV